MPAVRAHALVLVLLLPALAGCLGGDGAGDSSPGALTNSSAPGGAAAPGAAAPLPPGRAEGTPPAGVTAATQWVRDAWGEASEVPLLEEDAVVLNWLTTAVATCTLNCADAFLEPPAGRFVLPGASEVVVTATWTAPATAPTAVVELAWRTAGPSPPQLAELRSGEPLVIPTNAEDWDAPFQARSLWWFVLSVSSSRADAVFPEMPVDVSIVVRRAPGDLPSYPEASDPWEGGSELPLFAGATLRQTVMRGPFWNACVSAMVVSCDGFWFEAPQGAVVPPGAERIRATISWTWPGPTKPVLYWYTNAEDGLQRLEPVEDGATSRTYELDVPEDELDSPYQPRSMWWFFHSFDTSGQEVANHVDARVTLDAVVLRG